MTTPDPDGAADRPRASRPTPTTGRTASPRSTILRSGDTLFTYDTVGNLTNLRDASNNDTAWPYDGLSRVTQETNELNDSRYFVYDAASNLIRKTDRNSRVTRYEYDNLDRLTSEVWITGGSPRRRRTATTTQGPTNEVQRVGFSRAAFLARRHLHLDLRWANDSALAWNATAGTVWPPWKPFPTSTRGEVSVIKITDMLPARSGGSPSPAT